MPVVRMPSGTMLSQENPQHGPRQAAAIRSRNFTICAWAVTNCGPPMRKSRREHFPPVAQMFTGSWTIHRAAHAEGFRIRRRLRICARKAWISRLPPRRTARRSRPPCMTNGVTISGDSTSGSATIKNVLSTTGLAIGDKSPHTRFPGTPPKARRRRRKYRDREICRHIAAVRHQAPDERAQARPPPRRPRHRSGGASTMPPRGRTAEEFL